MDFQKQVDYWREGSKEDLDAADSLLENHKIRHAFIFAHLAVEKILKAHVTKATEDIPPRIHDLLRLAHLTGLPISDLQKTFLSRLQRYCLEGRYPDLKLSSPSVDVVKNLLQESKNICLWLANQ